jgi:hypothetical protein
MADHLEACSCFHESLEAGMAEPERSAVWLCLVGCLSRGVHPSSQYLVVLHMAVDSIRSWLVDLATIYRSASASASASAERLV